jgi:hypothetical protein
VPPGVFTSSGWGVNGTVMDWDSLLGGLVDERTRLCEIMFPDGDTVTLELGCDVLGAAPSFELVESVGETAFPSVGVGGVMNVVGASTRLGGVAGICVMMRLGAVERGDVVDCAKSPVPICGGEAWNGSSRTLVSRFFPPNSVPSPPPLVLGLALSAPPTVLGDVDLRLGVNASFNLPTGDGETPRLLAAISIVLACRMDPSSAEVTDSAKGPSAADPMESIVSEAIRGEDSVKSPAWDGCGEMPGLFAGKLGTG